jgi:hypothetical protein
MVLALLAGALASSAVASAQGRASRNEAAAEPSAEQALAEGRYQEAAERFRRAGERTPPALLWFLLAEAQAKAGNLVHAHELLALVHKELSEEQKSAGLQQLRRESAERAEILDLRTPKVTISVRGAEGRDLRVSLDGRRVWTGQIQRVNPGEHEVKAESDDASTRRRFLAVEGREALVELMMPRRRPASRRALRPVAVSPPSASGSGASPEPAGPERAAQAAGISWLGPGIVWAMGSFAGIVSVTASVIASDKADDILAQCVDNVCPASLIPEVQEVEDLDDVAIGTGVVAGATGVLGALMVLAQLPADEDVFAVGPGTLHYRTRF